MVQQTVFVNEFTDGILDPNKKMLGPVADGGHIVANTAPGCWGPMMTPQLKGGHEVTKPVYVEGAEVGDAIAIRIKSIQITSQATASGSDSPVDGRFVGDPFVAGKCPECGGLNPASTVEGLGKEAIRCQNCGADVTPFVITNGYTMAFDSNRSVGVTLNKDGAEAVGENGKDFMATPEASVQNPVVSFAPHDLVGTVARVRAFLGQLGTTPSKAFPDSHNAGDFAQFLIDAPHDYGMPKEELKHRTDGHMDINRVRTGAVLIAPVKVAGGGVYLGDMHAMQGNGEIAGHTTDVSGIVNLQVKVIKGLELDGPILLPVEEDLPFSAKPLTEQEKAAALDVAKGWGMSEVEDSLPVSFVGSGATLNEATDNGLQRAAKLFGISVEEVMNRATITGSIDIGRNPGVVTVTFLVPIPLLDKTGLTDLIRQHYQK
ncbi:Formamidase [Lentibacillus sp. JNUCC-1]|uniref:acetamidase/formamidase family protein n=1 Tax=Lentibacillus sp. JNUCC-1 TaxID=2654513 RepID=UPI0012E7E3FF|nr:acetamidase/formamidase family protein [Lentibacillus sp. JNUCC-1]MUV37669.1 Formamidase [Lentibacillus sp. JNUCC-1]